MCGGKIKYILIAYFLGNIYAKNCRNRIVYVKFIASCKGGTFFETQCSLSGFVQQIKLVFVSFWAHVNIVYRIVSYRVVIVTCVVIDVVAWVQGTCYMTVGTSVGARVVVRYLRVQSATWHITGAQRRHDVDVSDVPRLPRHSCWSSAD